jgi:hypothetical protein
MTTITQERRMFGTVQQRIVYKENSCPSRVQLPNDTVKEKTNSSLGIRAEDARSLAHTLTAANFLVVLAGSSNFATWLFDEDAPAWLTVVRLSDNNSTVPGRGTAPKEEAEKEEARDFLEEVYRRDGQNVDAAGDFVFDRIDRMLCQGKFGLCDRILREVEVGKLSTFVLTALLNITSAAKGPRLPSRPDFFSGVREQMVQVRGAEKAARILKGLE